eukprot:TRINITY_DN3153_c0_g1_i10.p1 TRINITY_DN3153_c0_g1~~TRINITY_DN3153_c0_g1_i10.p1  ORF type:complete len:291 (-),score=25.35 TRINITY_DN3153_c0_g1_i10:104-976(-)
MVHAALSGDTIELLARKAIYTLNSLRSRSFSSVYKMQDGVEKELQRLSGQDPLVASLVLDRIFHPKYLLRVKTHSDDSDVGLHPGFTWVAQLVRQYRGDAVLFRMTLENFLYPDLGAHPYLARFSHRPSEDSYFTPIPVFCNMADELRALYTLVAKLLESAPSLLNTDQASLRSVNSMAAWLAITPPPSPSSDINIHIDSSPMGTPPQPTTPISLSPYPLSPRTPTRSHSRSSHHIESLLHHYPQLAPLHKYLSVQPSCPSSPSPPSSPGCPSCVRSYDGADDDMFEMEL